MTTNRDSSVEGGAKVLLTLNLATGPGFGIYRPWEVTDITQLVFCANCWKYYYAFIEDEAASNSLQWFREKKSNFFKGCPECKTDGYLAFYDSLVKGRLPRFPFPPIRPVNDPNEGQEFLGEEYPYLGGHPFEEFADDEEA